MAEVTLIGGFASSHERYTEYAQIVGEHRQKPTRGYGFREASTHLEEIANTIDRQEVITHSGGLLVVHDAMKRFDVQPETIMAIAPSIQSQVRSLVARGLLIGLHNPAEQEQFEQKVETDTGRHELTDHPLFNARLIRRLGHFGSLEFLAELAANDTNVTVALMSHDGLFDNHRIKPERLQFIERLSLIHI